MTGWDQLPEINYRWHLVIYNALAFAVGVKFLMHALAGDDAMPVLLYAGATVAIGAPAWSFFFALVHLVVAAAILGGMFGAASIGAALAAMVYVALGTFASMAEMGLVIEEFSFLLHAPVQAVTAYSMGRLWLLSDA